MINGMNDSVHMFNRRYKKRIDTYYEEGVSTDACDSMAETLPETCDGIEITQDFTPDTLNQLLCVLEKSCQFLSYEFCYGALVVSTVHDNRIFPYGSEMFLGAVAGAVHGMGLQFSE